MASNVAGVEISDSSGKLAKLGKQLLDQFKLIKSENSLVDAREGIQTFIIYVNNIVKNPDEPKYRRIRIENVNYQERLGHLKGGQKLLELIGYESNGNGFLECKKSKHTEGNQTEILHVQKLAFKFLDDTDEEFQNVPWYEPDAKWKCVKAAVEKHDIGLRPTMEDGYMFIDGFAGREDQGLFCVYDGHGGKATVDFLTCGFHLNMAYHLQQNPEMDVPASFAKVYEHTDAQIRRQQILQSGSTAITCLIRNEEEKIEDGPDKGKTRTKKMLYVANVGDSRGVLCKDGKAIRMSKDHKASDAEEKDRIEKAGGFVTRFDRVNGLLAISRAFGDHLLKPAVSCVPYQQSYEIDSTTPYFILACDGIWDVISDQEAVDFVNKSLVAAFGENDPGAAQAKLQVALQTISKEMIQNALDAGSQDNISMMLVYF